jgi:hypothetical protein
MVECWNCGADLDEYPPEGVDTAGMSRCRVCEAHDPEGRP